MTKRAYWSRRVIRAVVVVAVVFAGIRSARVTRAEEPPAQKAAAPSAAEVEKAERLMKQVFADDYAKHTAEGRVALAKKLLESGSTAQDDPAGRFVLWSNARDLAAAAGDFETATAAIDSLDAAYLIDATPMRIAALVALDQANRSNPTAEFAQNCLNLAYPMLSGGNFEGAAKVASLAESVARRAKDTSIAGEAHNLASDARRLTIANNALARNPQDREAATTMGAYLCFVRANWTKGLPLLARGSDKVLAALAAQELKSPAKPDDQFELASGWWDAAQRQSSLFQNGAEAHAADWYRKAIPGLKTLMRAMAEKRAAAHPVQGPAVGSKTPAGGPSAVPKTASRPKPFTNSLGITFVFIPAEPAGFDMGSPITEPGHTDDEILHHVTLTKPYWMATTHVTVAQFAAFVKATGYVTDGEKNPIAGEWTKPRIPQRDDHPVVLVTWPDTLAFCTWLSRKEGRTYHLPTEAQWEYAARGGTTTTYFWGNDPDGGKGYANCADNSLKGNTGSPPPSYFNWTDGYQATSPVGSFKPNAFGLYDMIGNAAQWCFDDMLPYPAGAVVDPGRDDENDGNRNKVYRGGGWNDGPETARCAQRFFKGTLGRSNSIGFRLCLDSPDSTTAKQVARKANPAPPPMNLPSFKNSIGTTFVAIPLDPKGFMMGTPATEAGRSNLEVLHHVTLTKPFWLATTHVTVAQFEQFVKDSGYRTDVERGEASIGRHVEGTDWRNPGFTTAPSHPVVLVTWNDATAFCDWLSTREGRRYRLPTEAEWEYSARAGTTTAYFWGDDPEDGNGYINCADLTTVGHITPPLEHFFNFSDGYNETSPVGTFKPNRFGLYDMIGNAMQWCADYDAFFEEGDVTDPIGKKRPGRKDGRILRGSNWFSEPRKARIGHRTPGMPNSSSNGVGFRLCLDEAEAKRGK